LTLLTRLKKIFASAAESQDNDFMFGQNHNDRYAHRLRLPPHLQPFFSPVPKEPDLLLTADGLIDFKCNSEEYTRFGRSLVLRNVALVMMVKV